MKKFLTVTIVGIALIGFTACKSKVDTTQNAALESKANALDNQAETVRKDSKVDAADQTKQAILDADATKAAASASAEAEKKKAQQAANGVRQTGEQAAENLEARAKEIRDQKSSAPEASATP